MQRVVDQVSGSAAAAFDVAALAKSMPGPAAGATAGVQCPFHLPCVTRPNHLLRQCGCPRPFVAAMCNALTHTRVKPAVCGTVCPHTIATVVVFVAV